VHGSVLLARSLARSLPFGLKEIPTSSKDVRSLVLSCPRARADSSFAPACPPARSPIRSSACLPSLALVRYFQREFESMTECLNVLLSRWPINAARRWWYRVTMSSCMYICIYVHIYVYTYVRVHISIYMYMCICYRVSISAAWPRCGERENRIVV